MPKQPLHTIRIEPELWAAAQAEAARRDETVSEAIRRALRRYTRPRKDAA